MLLPGLICAMLVQAAPISLQKVTDNIVAAWMDTEPDPDMQLECITASSSGRENGADARELFLKVPMSDAEVSSLVSSQLGDGSWPDIDYGNDGIGFWEPSLHAFRISRLAIYYCQKGSGDALDCALKAMDYWFSAPLKYTNWWHAEIGIPRLLGPAFLMLKERMGPERLEKAIGIMPSASIQYSGQNKVWLAGNVLLKALLLNDKNMAVQARDEILSELRFADYGEEGLQYDFSFHQHGPQLQQGNYGLSFAVTMSQWARAFEGTGLNFTPEQLELLRSYIRNGLCVLVWNNLFDTNACGRHVFPNSQRGKALCVHYAARNIGLDEKIGPLAIYYPCSDFGVYRGKGWYASIRMQSCRTIGFENTNDENMKGYFSSDGALLVRVDGEEYNDIWPVWDWHHIPGVTAWDDGKPIWGKRNGNGAEAIRPYNNSSKVAGLVKDRYMIAAMDYDRDTLTCRKAWFFFDKGIVCLGAGITKPGESRVTTTIEQSWFQGRMRKGVNWARNGSMCYFLLSDADYEADVLEHKGQWNWMSPELPTSQIGGRVFEMVIDHGSNPVDASYAYAVIPGRSLCRAKRCIKTIEVMDNNTHRQCITVGKTTMSVDWDRFELEISE